MAVQQNKKSPSHDALNTEKLAISVDGKTGEVHRRHHVSPTGMHRGRKVLATKSDE